MAKELQQQAGEQPAPPEFNLAEDIRRCTRAYRNSLIMLLSLTSITTLSVAIFVSLTH